MPAASGMPWDLRRLRYFVAVAEELHFGRAAAQLYITQPVLSRQIQRLEEELGAPLFVRRPRDVALTEVGERLLAEARPLLAAGEAAQRRVRDAVDGQATLVVGFFVGDTFTEPLREFARARPGASIHLRRLYWHDQVSALNDGRVDVAFLHLPVDDAGLELLAVRTEPRVAVLPARHAAAGRSHVSIEDLAEDPVVLQRGASAVWEAFHNVDPRPDGRRPRPGPSAGNIEEKLELVAAEQAISFLPASAAAAYAKPGTVYVPVADIPPIEIRLAWPADRRSPLVDDFVRIVRGGR